MPVFDGKSGLTLGLTGLSTRELLDSCDRRGDIALQSVDIKLVIKQRLAAKRK